jgi:hypothetical protein
VRIHSCELEISIEVYEQNVSLLINRKKGTGGKACFLKQSTILEGVKEYVSVFSALRGY